MKPEAQRIAIAAAHGWKLGRNEPPPPNYLGDLNAMHEVENKAGVHIIKAMRFWLWESCGQMEAHHATAAQRAEAFLRAKNLWVE